MKSQNRRLKTLNTWHRLFGVICLTSLLCPSLHPPLSLSHTHTYTHTYTILISMVTNEKVDWFFFRIVKNLLISFLLLKRFTATHPFKNKYYPNYQIGYFLSFDICFLENIDQTERINQTLLSGPACMSSWGIHGCSATWMHPESQRLTGIWQWKYTLFLVLSPMNGFLHCSSSVLPQLIFTLLSTLSLFFVSSSGIKWSMSSMLGRWWMFNKDIMKYIE